MSLEQCKAILSDNALILENSRIRREFLWNGGHLVSRRIEDLRRGGRGRWRDRSRTANCPDRPAKRRWHARGGAVPATAVSPEHLRVDCTYRLGDLWVRRRFRIYPDCPAIACDFYLKGKPDSTGEARTSRRGAGQHREMSRRPGRGRSRRR